MVYEVTVKMKVKSHRRTDRVKALIESALEFGTAREAIADGAKLGEDPNYVRVKVRRIRRKVCRQIQHVAAR